MARYLVHFAIAFLALLGVVTGFTRLIDPYDYWGRPTWSGLNRYKPAAGKHLKAVKLRQIARVQPVTIVAGNSRVAVGFDPASPAWPPKARPVYNLGLPGYSTEGVVQAVLAALNTAPVRHVVLAVDFMDFRIDRQSWRSWREVVPPTSDDGVREKVEVLLSLDALTDSLVAVREQHVAHPADITPNGFDALNEYKDVVADEGYATLFEQRNRENASRYLTGPKAVAWPDRGGSDDWAALRQITDECRRRGIDLTIITYPYHIDFLVMLQDAGLWPVFEDWQRRLAAFGAAREVPIWSFTAVRPETTERVPERGDIRTAVRDYWEAGHFKDTMGARIVVELSGAKPSLGTRLTLQSIDTALADLRAGVGQYRATRPKDAERVDATVAAVSSGIARAARP